MNLEGIVGPIDRFTLVGKFRPPYLEVFKAAAATRAAGEPVWPSGMALGW